MASIETQWNILLGDAYDTLNLYTKGKGIGDVASQFLIEMFHPQEILKEKSKRDVIIGVLPEEYARDLASILKLPNDLSIGSLYGALRNTPFKGKAEKAFLDYFGIDPEPKIEEEITIGVEHLSEPLLEYPLRDYQQKIIQDVESIFSTGSRRCMIHMPTGSGKTRTAMYYISEKMNKQGPFTVLWLAYSKELCDQSSDEFCRVWKARGNKEATVYRYYGNSTCTIPKTKFNGIIVTTLSKIISARKKDDMLLVDLSDNIDLVVFDEAHQIIAPQYQSIVDNIVNLSRYSNLIGLTATPGRTWDDLEEDSKLAKYFKRNIVSIQTKDGESPNAMLTREGYLSQIQWRYCECETPKLDADDLQLIAKLREEDEIPSNVLETISVDAVRNTKIVSEVEKLLIEGRKRILLFATSVSHAHLMCGILKIFASKYNCKVDCITGSTSKGTREEIIDTFRTMSEEPYVLCNYGVLTTGFDAPNVDAGVIARPTKSLVLFSQMVGRMIRGPRTPGGTEDAIIVSVVDIGLPGFKDSYNNWSDVWK